MIKRINEHFRFKMSFYVKTSFYETFMVFESFCQFSKTMQATSVNTELCLNFASMVRIRATWSSLEFQEFFFWISFWRFKDEGRNALQQPVPHTNRKMYANKTITIFNPQARNKRCAKTTFSRTREFNSVGCVNGWVNAE